MKVQLLVLENIEQEIQNEVKNQIGENNLSGYDKVLRELEGEKVDENQPIFIDVTKYLKTTDFYFKIQDVKGLFMSTSITKFNDKVMVLLLNDREYDCIFDKDIFEKIKNYLENE